MKSKRYGSQVVLRIDDGEELLESVLQACRQQGVQSALVSGIGALQFVRLRVLNSSGDGFVYRDIQDMREITNISGNITLSGQTPFLHLHLTAADGNMELVGGHVERCIISNTAELWLLEPEGGTVQRAEIAQGLLRQIELED